MIILRSTTAGVLRHPEVVVIRSIEEAQWNVDGTPVSVGPGLVVGFRDPEAAAFLVGRSRAESASVEPGDVVPVLQDDLGMFFVGAGLAVEANGIELDDGDEAGVYEPEEIASDPVAGKVQRSRVRRKQGKGRR